MFYIVMEERRAKREGRSRWTAPCRICQQVLNDERRRPRREYCAAIKLASGCVDCGIRSPHPEIYDFDHVGDVKHSNVSAFMTSGTWEGMLAEIAKCEVVCANCHRIRTASRPAVGFGLDRKSKAS